MVDAGFFSLLPVLVTLAIAVWTRNVVLGLFLGVFSGVLLLNGINPFTGMSIMVEDYLVAQAAKSSNMGILILMIFIAGLVGLMEKSGGAAAFASMMIKYINGKIKAQMGAWASGCLLFFTDSGTPLIVGPLFRPIIDGLKISRAKLAWIIDTTASPVAVLIPFIGWGLYTQGLIGEEYKTLGITESPFVSYVKAVPFQFYSLMAVIMVPLFVFSKTDFGPMKIAEDNAAKGIVAKDQDSEVLEKGMADANAKAKPILVWLPLSIMLTIMFSLLFSKGFPFDMSNLPSNAFRASLATGYVFAAVALISLMAWYGIKSLADGFALYLSSISRIINILAILVLAWSLGAVGKDLGAPAYIAALIGGNIPAFLIPVIAFMVGGIISFSTGSSWGTYAILIPLVVPLAFQFDISMYVCIGAVLSGGLFGDHCSPISDTTILSATGAGCSHLEHVKTQLPYAVFNGICCLAAFVVAGLTGSAWALLVAAGLMLVGMTAIKRFTAAAPNQSI
ncbi:MAG: sodium:proton exchanger [Robiginitomaculum sp.]|nr:MAG: sodium:proton exchanger [Robiginitomaculum sp.]